MITVYGRVTEIEPTIPGGPVPVPDPPPIARGAARGAEAKEGEEPEKTWVHVHIVLDSPHAGELELNTPAQNVTGMLAVGGRARVILASS